VTKKENTVESESDPPACEVLLDIPDYGYIRDSVYLWGFSYLDYPLNISISNGHTSSSSPEDVMLQE